jgi:hypothetical protein
MKKKVLFFVLLAGVLLINTSPSAALGDITPVLTILLLDDGFPVVEPRVVTLNDVLVRPWGLAFNRKGWQHSNPECGRRNRAGNSEWIAYCGIRWPGWIT